MLNMNESRHVWMSHVMYEWVVLYMNESCDMMCDVIWCAMWYDVRCDMMCEHVKHLAHTHTDVCVRVCVRVFDACVCVCVWCVCVCVCLMHTCACVWCIHACVRVFDAYMRVCVCLMPTTNSTPEPDAIRDQCGICYIDRYAKVRRSDTRWYAKVRRSDTHYHLCYMRPSLKSTGVRTYVCVCVCVCVCIC